LLCATLGSMFKETSPLRLRLVQYIPFIAMGIVMSLLGPLVPPMRRDIGLDYTMVGLVFGAQYAGTLISLPASPALLRIFGTRAMLIAGTFIFSSGIAVMACATGLSGLIAGNVVAGIGVSFLDITVSTLCMDTSSGKKGRRLGYLHGTFGLGATLGPFLAIPLSVTPGAWRVALWVSAAIPLLIFFVLPGLRLPSKDPSATKTENTLANTKRATRQPFIWLVGVCLFVYVGVEWTVGAWFPSFWKEGGASWLDPSAATALFWLSFTVGRFTQGRFADKIGFHRWLTLTIFVAGLCSLAWCFLPGPASSVIIVFVFGFAIASMYPTFVAMASKRHPEQSGLLAMLMSIFGSCGSMLLPPLMGSIADRFSMGVLPYLQCGLVCVLAVVACASFQAERRTR